MQTIGIMGAMPEEVTLLAGALENMAAEEYAGVTYYRGHRGGKKVVVCCAGMGKANAAATTQVLITRYGVGAIFFSGIAGNTSEAIGIGDVVIGKTLCYHDAENRMLAQSAPNTALYTADPALVEAARQGCELTGVRYLVGKIATGDCFVGDGATKRRIVAACAPDCVEMEGAAVAQIAMRNKVPFVVIRAMSDNSDTSIHTLGAENFEIEAYVKTASAITMAAVDSLP
ncbi:MAG: 5'-methylthioadenosine/adenosylhomocysteine nucleosidase [Oscillospiraceae bacterium]